MIEIVEVTNPTCQKCEHVWRILSRFADNNSNLRIYKIGTKQIGKKIIRQYQVEYVPFIMVYLNGELKGVIKIGFTVSSLKFQIETLTKEKISI